jgi:hypothetical protein
MARSYSNLVDAPGPKKLLALDGGGIRGIMTIEILMRIEELLRVRLDEDQSFVLGDYFDYVAGTSTGAIIAVYIALGRPMADILKLYVERGADMFDRASFLDRVRFRYGNDKLRNMLQQQIGTKTLFGDDKLRTLLLLVMRNATTDSPWPLSNNPKAMYNDRARPDCNLLLPLWQLVLASTAAPTYFPPETISVGPDRQFIFVDGGVTMYNSPAFLAFLMATLEPYRLCWKTGEENMLIVSVGTGASAAVNWRIRPSDMTLLYNVSQVPAALMYAAQIEQDQLCRALGRCTFGAPIDRELGDMMGLSLPVPRQFSYVRYEIDTSAGGLDDLGLGDIEPSTIQQIDSVRYVKDLQRVGRAYAGKYVRLDHLASFA